LSFIEKEKIMAKEGSGIIEKVLEDPNPKIK